MRQQISAALERRWQSAVAGLTAGERARLLGWLPELERTDKQGPATDGRRVMRVKRVKMISRFSPTTTKGPAV